MHECVGEGHTLNPAALKCALPADCKMERDNNTYNYSQSLAIAFWDSVHYLIILLRNLM